MEDLTRFTSERGFVLCAPESGLHYPSVLEAAVGRPLVEHAFDERGSHADAWVRECVAAGQVMHGVVVAQRATLVDRSFVEAFFALAGQRGDLEDHLRLQRQGRLSGQAGDICAWLAREGRALSLTELEARLQVRGPIGRRRLMQCLEEVVQTLLVVPIAWQPTTPAAAAFEPVCDLVPRVFGDSVRAALGTSPESFPFGLTIGAVAYGRSGWPITTKVLFNSKYFYPEGRGDMGRLPFTFWADLYLDYTLKFAGRYRASINLQINNITNTSTIQEVINTPNTENFSGNTYYKQILEGSFVENYQTIIAGRNIVHSHYRKWSTRFNTWSARLGFKFSF